MDATVMGRVVSKGIIPTRKGLRIFQAVVRDETGMIEVRWPGQPFLDRVIHKDDVLLLSGSVRFFHGRQLQPREFVNLGAEEEGTAGGRVLAVYPATEGISVKVLRGLIDDHLDALLAAGRGVPAAGVSGAPECPRWPTRCAWCTARARSPRPGRGRAQAGLRGALLRPAPPPPRQRPRARGARAASPSSTGATSRRRVREALPYELTGAQTRVLREIVADMCSPRRMHRLLQGDVGSGKTVVALFAALLAMENGYQAAIMAPTELLAEQHIAHADRPARAARRGADPGHRAAGRARAARGGRAARRAASRCSPSARTRWCRRPRSSRGSGFVAIDEQHRFGVEQRAALGTKGERPDVLLMSATPIPRSLALTFYGDLDVSTIDERPPAACRSARRCGPSRRASGCCSSWITSWPTGRQAYVVYPVIDESEKTDLKAATTMHAELAAGPFAHRRIALLHGRMPAEERDEVMRRFRDGELDVLVATTVIEVGIDVPNATVMLIEHPERFGLSQLHQLRGRVGRGAESRYCILLGDVGPETAERLQLFTATEDGFEIARADLRLRGMGDLFGERQSGMPAFRVADPLRDMELNELARGAAERILADDPGLARNEHAPLRRVLGERYSRSLALFRVG